ncbi:MAG: hypothetical protein AABY32_07150 [Nanoarchaeota archaeon]
MNFENEKIKVEKKNNSVEFTLPDGTKLERLPIEKEKNIEYLDIDKKVFTRSDISALQLPYLSIGQKHEEIIKILKPFLEEYRGNADLGCLLIASTIIKLEDKLEDKKLIHTYYDKLKIYKKVGHMIYNFFRSGILEKRIIPHLRKICESYNTNGEIKRNFLIYWYDIIGSGYPTAYYANDQDTQQEFYNELNWRFDRGEKNIEVYSRITKRNRRIRRWLKRLEKRGVIKFRESKIYRIGYSKAIKFYVTKI